MDDDRFNLLKDNEVKNKRGRKWVDVPNNNENLDDSDDESVSAQSYDSSDGSYMELNEGDDIDVDFDNLVNDAESTNDSTKRLAVMHFDFDQYPLSYLAVIIKSALPKNGKIKSITKYPSNEYMERYHDDIKYGPKEYLRTEDDKEYDSDESGDSIEASKAMRKYQISRLKFFYTIFEFDSIETSDCVYDMLDNKDLGDSGLKLDLRYVDPDRKFEIPEEFAHLVEKLRPNSSKFKGYGFKPSCFSEIKVRDTWDTLPQQEEFNLRAFEGTDNELSDAEDFYNNDTSDYSASECESDGNNEDDTDGPKIQRFRGRRLPAEELRAKLGLPLLDSEDKEEDDVEEEEEEVESIGGSGDEIGLESSEDDSHDEYVIDEAADEEEHFSDSEEENENKQENKSSKQNKKISHREKMKSILKEKAEKKSRKVNETRDFLKSVAQNDDRFDEFLYLSKSFAITRTHSKYDNAKMFLEMMNARAEILNVKPDFNADTSDAANHSAPASKKRKIK